MEKLQVIVLGACNSGKSSLVNQITGQQTALVSEIAGTTTDPVRKSMELPGIGAAVIIDTAGFDDISELGQERVATTIRELAKADVAILLTGKNIEAENQWRERLKERKTPIVEVPALTALDASARQQLFESILRAIPEDFRPHSILPDLAKAGDFVVLVMPQDSQAPVGRLILPQVQTIRELLDMRAIPVCCTPEQLHNTLNGLQKPPALIITDSQVFRQVFDAKPAQVPLTSFSILMAAKKGDLPYFAESVKMLADLDCREGKIRILIAEACTHAPKNEDIGRVKIPAMLRKRYGNRVEIDFVRGVDFPSNPAPYDLIIHCGGCMFNRRLMLSRVESCRLHAVPMTNYGVLLAALTGILPHVKTQS